MLAGAGVASVLLAQGPTIDVKIVKVPYDMKKLLQPSGLSAEALQGRVLWLQKCAFCHDGVGTPTYNTLGPWIDSEVMQKRGDAAVREKILKGSATMPAFQYGLSAAQVEQLLAFLKTVSPNEKPSPQQKAGKAPPPGDL